MRLVILTLLLLASYAGLNAQRTSDLLLEKNEKNLIVKDYNVSSGLTSNSVRKIGKSINGFLFIATYNGISLFDGKNFINYTTNNVPEIKSNNIYDFCVDKDSVFWIATHIGIVCYNGNKFYTPPELEKMSAFTIQCIDIDKSGTLWMGTTSDGLYKYKDNKLKKVTALKDIEKNIISLIFADKEGSVWIGTENGDLYRYSEKKYHKILHSEINNGMLAAIQDNEGTLYFGTRNGLYTFKNNSVALVSKDINFINNIRQDKRGRIWLATNSGLYYYNKKTNSFATIFNKKGITNQIIQSIYFDEENIIWVGTYRKGLLQVRIGAFQNFNMSANNITQIPSSLCEIDDSTLWVGTDEGKILELKNGKYNEVTFKSALNNSRIKNIFLDSKNTIWICSYKGLLKYKNGTENILNNTNGLPDNTVRNIVEDNSGKYWVGTRQSGLYLITENLKIVKKYNTSNGLSSNFIMSLVKGKNGEIYIATKNGIDIIENEKIISKINSQNGLAEDMVFNVYEDDDNVLWAATITGLSRIENNSIVSFTKQTGLVDDKIFDVLEDDFGYLWLPTINGILRLNKAELNDYAHKKRNFIYSVMFDKSDGLFDPQYVSASKSLKKKNGEIVFNTISGISFLDPKIANNSSSKQSLSIKSISTETDVYINKGEDLHLPSYSRYLQIDFSYIDFVNPDKVQFKYMLEPFDLDWQSSKNDRFAKYTNLPPGDYTFRLKAIIQSEGGKTLEQTLSFTIEPAFYETVLFRIILALSVILIIWFVYALRVRTIKHQKELLEREVFERTIEITKQKEAIEKNIKYLEIQKAEIAEKNEEILITRNEIEQAYLNLKLLSDLGKEITSSLSEEEIIMTVYQNINSLMDTDLVSIGIFNASTKKLRFNSTIFKGKKIEAIETDLDEKNCLISFSIENCVDIISNNFVKDYPGISYSFPQISTFKNLTSVIVLLLRSNNEIIGILTAQSFRKDSYSDYHFNLLKNLAVYVSIAIENAKTYKKIRKQKDELQQVNMAKDKMFSIIGHDLRGPVGTIKSFLDLILENPELTSIENTMEIFKTMQQSLGSAYTLLDNLLLWARSQRGQIEFKPNNFYIKQPIDESISLIAENARNKEISIETIINFNEKVYADQNMITTVLRNLISNAIKFTPRKGKIKIITSRFVHEQNGKSEEQIEVQIVDNGIGISNENINKILKMNELFSTPGTEKEQGSGLGIGICIDFLKAHDQSLIVENNQTTKEEKGSTFKFYLNTTK